MQIKKILIVFLMVGLSLTANATDKRHMNTTIDISYAIVESVGQTKIDSDMGRNAAMGGVVGAATSGSHQRGKHAVQGAVAAGIITAILEGKRKAYIYQVTTMSGAEKRIITEQMGIREGDCVSLEEGPTTNIRRVPPVHCEYHNHDFMSDPMVQSKGNESAAECHAVKAILMKANSEEEVDVALKKVQVFCD